MPALLVQLLVVQADQNLLRSSLVVTVDNTPPEIEIAFPTQGAQIEADRPRLIFQINAQDELGLQTVTIYVDNILLTMAGITIIVASLIAAIMADQGLTERQFYLYMLPTFIGGIVPCFSEANERSEGTFLPLRCEQIAYAGPEKRLWNKF